MGSGEASRGEAERRRRSARRRVGEGGRMDRVSCLGLGWGRSLAGRMAVGLGRMLGERAGECERLEHWPPKGLAAKLMHRARG